MGFVITEEHLKAIRKARACKERLSLYRPGIPISEVYRDDLEWIEENLPGLAEEAAKVLSAEVGLVWGQLSLSMFGYGYGYGHGYGYSDGHGHGYGDGHGHGYGDGCGYGDGYGCGYGHGDGHGYGYGDGYGDGRQDIVAV